jgi:putative PIG3 family NAD(P)H quinone oxidoreductase
VTTLARAVRITAPGGPDVLALGDLELREPGFGEVRVDVGAAGLNRADTLQRRGVYPAPPGVPADVPGLEYAGTVAALGEGVRDVRVGERVMGIVAGGAMATQLVVHARETIPVPRGLSLAEAAALPEAFLTAYDAVVLQGGLASGDVLVVHAIGSGIGTAALQLARALGARTIGTSRTAEKLARCEALGLPLADGLVVTDGTFAERVQRATGGRGCDVVLDGVGAAYLEENVRALATGGRLVVIGLLAGANGALPLGALLQKRARVIGSVLRSRALEEKCALAQLFARRLVPLFESGALRPVVDAVLPMSEVREAHRRMEANETFGKVVLTW